MLFCINPNCPVQSHCVVWRGVLQCAVLHLFHHCVLVILSCIVVLCSVVKWCAVQCSVVLCCVVLCGNATGLHEGYIIPRY